MFYDTSFYATCNKKENKKVLNEYNKSSENQMATFSCIWNQYVDAVCISRIDSSDAQIITKLVLSLFSITLHIISHMETFSNSKQGNVAPTGKMFHG